ncbi:MAG: MFS transporter [Alphaproteobacteria bacterium]|nr:MFS transporter [Alphaproteobacteria bacterium]
MNKLTREQKEAIGLLQIGTFLEYFDFMLYVHMAVLLNELFFPPTDPHTASLLTALAFCSTWVFRPFGALIFGYIGDNIGRKTTVIITTVMMAISCIVMANLPTYAQIGIGAAWIVTICRIVQGFSSMGEIIGARIYVAEITKPPVAYPAVSSIGVAAAFGSMASVGVAALTTSYGFNWRMAFWIGACIAVVGSVARTRLRETPEFVNMKLKLNLLIEKYEKTNSGKAEKLSLDVHKFHKEKIARPTIFSYFLLQCGWPISFYLAYMYCNPFLKSVCHYSSSDIIFHNFMLTIVQTLQAFIWCVVSYYIHPLKIIRAKGLVFLGLAFLLPVCLFYQVSALSVFLVQALIMLFNIGEGPAQYIILKQLPVYKRFTASGFIYALGRAVTYIITSFGFVYLTKWFNAWGTLVITLPFCLGFFWSVRHFEKLENLRPNEHLLRPTNHAEHSHAA